MYHSPVSSRRLVLFDIDGTLVLTGGAGLRAMNRACEHIVGHQNALDGVTLAGRTDWIILDDALTRNGLSLDPRCSRSFDGATSSTCGRRSSCRVRA